MTKHVQGILLSENTFKILLANRNFTTKNINRKYDVERDEHLATSKKQPKHSLQKCLTPLLLHCNTTEQLDAHQNIFQALKQPWRDTMFLTYALESSAEDLVSVTCIAIR